MPGQSDILSVLQNGVIAINNLTRQATITPGSSLAPPTPTGAARFQRSVVAGPVVILSSDSILNLNIPAPTNIPLPTSASRAGEPLTFKDVGSQAVVNNITLTPNGAETIDGRANFVMRNNRQSVTVNPYNDGVNVGWEIL